MGPDTQICPEESVHPHPVLGKGLLSVMAQVTWTAFQLTLPACLTLHEEPATALPRVNPPCGRASTSPQR